MPGCGPEHSPGPHPQRFKEFKALSSVSTVGVERVFLGGTLDQGSPVLLELDVCPLTLDPAPGTEETVPVGALWGEGGVLGVLGALGGGGDVEAACQDDGSRDVVVVS